MCIRDSALINPETPSDRRTARTIDQCPRIVVDSTPQRDLIDRPPLGISAATAIGPRGTSPHKRGARQTAGGRTMRRHGSNRRERYSGVPHPERPRAWRPCWRHRMNRGRARSRESRLRAAGSLTHSNLYGAIAYNIVACSRRASRELSGKPVSCHSLRRP